MIRLQPFLIPVVAAGLVAGAHFAPKPSEAARRPSGVSVTQSTYACPTGPGVTVAAGQVAPGDESTATVLPDKSMDEGLGVPTKWRTSGVDGSAVIVEQQGRASGSVGFFGATASKGGGGGLVVGACAAVVDDAWFLGLGSGSKHFSSVTLTNIASAPAAVDLELWGSDGKIDAVDSKGIVVKPFATRRIQLADLAAGEPELGLRVLNRRGSVSASVNDQSTAIFGGTEAVSATATPREQQVLGGVVAGASGRTLALLNPGPTTARVEIEVIGPKNTFKPSGLEAIKVKAGALRLVDMPTSAGGDSQGLQVTSDVPVAATVRMAPSDVDYAYAESLPALDGPAIVPVDLGKDVDAPELILTAPSKKAKIQVLAYDEDMNRLGEVTLTIGGETTQRMDTSKAFKQQGIAYLVVQTKGEVIGAATYRDGARISSLGLRSAPITVLAPQVRPID